MADIGIAHGMVGVVSGIAPARREQDPAAGALRPGMRSLRWMGCTSAVVLLHRVGSDLAR